MTAISERSRYQSARAFSDRYIPTIQKIVGQHLLKPASFELDADEATDLIVMTARDIRIAARVRNDTYLDRYGYEFTIRSKVRSGVDTELDKVRRGMAQWMFYGFGAPDSDQIPHWWLIDLNAFCSALSGMGLGGPRVQYGVQRNKDGSEFHWFDLRSFPKKPSITIAGSRSLPPFGVAS